MAKARPSPTLSQMMQLAVGTETVGGQIRPNADDLELITKHRFDVVLDLDDLMHRWEQLPATKHGIFVVRFGDLQPL